MFIEYIVILLLAATFVAPPLPAFAAFLDSLRARARVPTPALIAAIAVVVASAHASLALVEAAYGTRPALIGLERDFPIKLMGFRDSYHLAQGFGTTLLALAIVQTIALAVVALAMLAPTRTRAVAVGIGAIVAACDALCAHVGTSGDVYSNVGYALLGMRSYLPPNVPFAGSFAPISQWWRTPLVPAPYGPLWIVILRIVTFAGPTLLAKIVLLRVFGIASIGAIVLLLRALRFSPATLALVALDPALTFEFVANVHNDLFAAAVLLGSRLAVERGRPRLGIAIAICAGLVKLPFALFSVTSFASGTDRGARIVRVGVVLVASFALSYALTGGALFAGIAHHLLEHDTGGGPAALVFSPVSLVRIVAILALVALALAAYWNEGIVYAIPLIGIQFYPWYAAWSLPYAALRERALVTFLLVLPVLRIVVDFTLASGDVVVLFQKAIMLALTVTIVLVALRRFRPRIPVV